MLDAVVKNEYLSGEHPQDLIKRMEFDIDDAIMVLSDSGLFSNSITSLEQAKSMTRKAANKPSSRIKLANRAVKKMNKAKSYLIN